ncbi:fluoride efflux transporter CrcB [Bacillus sp. FJAT-49732]|uniref:Fluoride-specific ion channel FluC n=1 Tax=Lederbergia citrisecunda TaxID=2833583 RepID=A0A942YM84_9BACI|nr:fluoride efflux transporter CrcB [Lederbergia citrisecunda]MBS4199071.1 fluoride efflux transporter CrcB [Lederbergia citrisecunda]
MKYLAVGIGGIIGSLLRYFVSYIHFGLPNELLPLDTLFVNLLGSYLLGLLTGLYSRFPNIPSYIQISIGTGLIGSFTTFSTFSNEIVQLMLHHHYLQVFVYYIGSFIGGLAMSWLGILNGSGRTWKKVNAK